MRIIRAQRRRWSILPLSPALWYGDTGSDASVWSDLSGSGRDGLQTVEAERPAIITDGLNGRQYRQFNGSSHWIYWNSEVAVRTAFAVWRRTGTHTQYSCLWGHSGSLSQYLGINNAWVDSTLFTLAGWRNGAWRRNGVLFDPVGANSDILNQWVVISVVTSENAATNRTRDRHFTTRVPKCDLAEMILFSNPLSDSNRIKIEQKLLSKYGIH